MLKLVLQASAAILITAALSFAAGAQVRGQPGGQIAPVPKPTDKPAIRLIETEPSVRLEVLDWGGSGPPLILLTGLGGTAENFQSFALDLRPRFHVYGITRRGYGGSSAPAPSVENYSADHLADDVLSVFDQLHLQRPLVVGHSLAGEELSSIGSRHPERVAGLVYIDAGYRYALSRPGLNDLQIDILSMRHYLLHALDDLSPRAGKAAADAFLTELPDFTKELRDYSHALAQAPEPSPQDLAKQQAERNTPDGRAERAILDGEQRYTDIRCPVLVLFAYPHALVAPGLTPEAQAAREHDDMAFVDQRLTLFRALPNAKIVLYPHATHGLHDSRRADVLAEIRAFADRVQH